MTFDVRDEKQLVARSCQRCGGKIPSPKSQHPNVKYCSERCSRPTVQEFEKHQANVRAIQDAEEEKG